MIQPNNQGAARRRPPDSLFKSISPWLAKLIIIFGLASSFSVPYFAVVVKEAYENRDWLKTGLSGYEIDEWKRENIAMHLAVRWRNEGVSAAARHPSG